jgi:hypothetical protein
LICEDVAHYQSLMRQLTTHENTKVKNVKLRAAWQKSRSVALFFGLTFCSKLPEWRG